MPRSDQNDASIDRWELLCLLAVAFTFLAIRWPLYSEPGLTLGWNSDAALLGLMARAIQDGSDYPVFFWGQYYLGTLTSYLCVVVAALMRAHEIGPLVLRIEALLEIGPALCFFWLALRRVFGRAPALGATFWLAAGPSFFFGFSIAQSGVETLFLVSSVLFWYVTRVRLSSGAECFVVGLLFGLGMWLHQGVMFLMVGIVVAAFVERLISIRATFFVVIGSLIGYSPAAISLLRNDPLLYKRALLGWSFHRVGENLIETVTSDVWLLLADRTPTGVVVGMCILSAAIAGLWHCQWTRGRVIAVSTIAVSAGFWILTTYPYAGAVRYIVPTVPLVYGAAALGVFQFWGGGGGRRVLAVVMAVVISAGIYVPRAVQAIDVAAGRSERHDDWPGDFDPRPTLTDLRDGGFRVCFGEVWVAHKLEFLSQPTVRFIPARSVHRTLRQSLRLIHEPGVKCYVDNSGRVTRLSAAEESNLAASVVLRARSAGM